jgi:hypothetical protein
MIKHNIWTSFLLRPTQAALYEPFNFRHCLLIAHAKLSFPEMKIYLVVRA